MPTSDALAELSAMLGRELVDMAKRRGAELGMPPGPIGGALAAATVYFARECGLSDQSLLLVMRMAMITTPDGERIGPVHVAPRKPDPEAS